MEEKKKHCSRFIHASDIHLGSHQFRNEERSYDFIKAFKEILSLSLYYRVKFIILGGDIFNSREILPYQLDKIVCLLKEFHKKTHSKIPIICIEGNHDIRKHIRGIKIKNNHNWLKFLNSIGLIYLLRANFDYPIDKIYSEYDSISKKGGKITFNNIVVYGNQFLGKEFRKYISKISLAIKKEKKYFNILIQHLGIEGQMVNVPGENLKSISILEDKVDYLALGHFHKQFSIKEWIFNPGSSEPVCSADFNFKRGAFLVDIYRNRSGKYTKEIKNLKLHNRSYHYEKIYVNSYFERTSEFNMFIINQLRIRLIQRKKISQINYKKPVLVLILRGIAPSKSCKFREKELTNKICYNFGFVDVRIYQKFKEPIMSLENYAN